MQDGITIKFYLRRTKTLQHAVLVPQFSFSFVICAVNGLQNSAIADLQPRPLESNGRLHGDESDAATGVRRGINKSVRSPFKASYNHAHVPIGAALKRSASAVRSRRWPRSLLHGAGAEIA